MGVRVDVVSVVIPTYNRADRVGRAIESALGQTHPHVEVLVVDDGSTDDTASRIEQRFASEIARGRLRVVRKRNEGVAAARNDGAALAQGKFLAFLDSDDEWVPDKLDVQLEVMRRRPEFGMVLSDVAWVDEQGRSIGGLVRRKALPHDGWLLPHVLRNAALVPSTVLLRRAVWEAVGGFDRTLPTAEDLDFHLRLALHHQIAVVERPLVRYLRGEHGLSGLDRTAADHVLVVERFVSRHAQLLSAEQRHEALFWVYLKNARVLFGRRKRRKALVLAGKALVHLRGARHLEAVADLSAWTIRRLGVELRGQLLAR